MPKTYIPAEIVEKQHKNQRKDLIFQLHQRAASLYKEERFNSCGICEAAATSLERYAKTLHFKTINFDQLTPKFLYDYEKWMLKEGKCVKNSETGVPASTTTVRMYMQFIKYAHSRARMSGILIPNPFVGDRRYIIPMVTGGRQPRTQIEVQKIIGIKLDSKKDQFNRDLWVLSFLCNGMNMKDICLLKHSDINWKTKTLTFVREKSKATTRAASKIISVALLDESLEILHKWKTEKGYLLPILNEEMTPLQVEAAKKYLIIQINATMKKIGASLGIEGDLRSYVARHSFVNILMQAEVPIAFISQALGHSKISTTQTYMSKFSNEKSREYASRLLSSKKG